ncbi:hypothetical protein Sango_1097600 [Sesamum angolense]|uniref:BRO1 domain-containing protein n=1 Tax=Sesamum angolense TaxID=2727404 RepID=A0AAE1WUS6_9LAMI|nr:hypothetical protein Sango_1097600 [Sesamum angolense]
MMISFPGLSKLKTKPVVYQDVLLASDPGTLEQLKELSSKRKAIEVSINESSSVTEAIAREMSGGLTSRCEQDIQKLERYLPLLENLVHHVNLNRKNGRIIFWISGLNVRWSSVLTPSSIFHLQGPKFYQVNDLYFELGMTLFLYGALLCEQALEVVASDLVQSATLFRKAAGLYNYLAQEVLISLPSDQLRPPEATPSVSSIMSFICLADAQLRLLNDFALNFNDRFILGCKTLHELVSYKYLAESLKNDGKIGIAVGILRLALANARKNVPKEESWTSVYKHAIDELTGLLRKYEHENEFVWREKVPWNDELPCPEGWTVLGGESFRIKLSSLFSTRLLCVLSWKIHNFDGVKEGLDWFDLLYEKVSALVSEEKIVESSDSGTDIFKLTYLEGNSWLWEVGGVRILVDPILVGNLDFGIPWLYDAAKKFLKNFKLDDLPEIDCLLITQSLDDHCHLNTLKPLSRRLPNLRVITTPNAKALLDPLFSNVTYLEPGQGSEIQLSNGSSVKIQATAGPVLGPPWQRPENGYLVTSPEGQLRLYYEPHCVYNENFLEKKQADIVITPVIKQLLPNFSLVSGQEDAVRLSKLLEAKYVYRSMKNGDLDSKGLLSSLIESQGTIESFKEILLKELPEAKVLEPTPGVPLEISAPANSS